MTIYKCSFYPECLTCLKNRKIESIDLSEAPVYPLVFFRNTKTLSVNQNLIDKGRDDVVSS